MTVAVVSSCIEPLDITTEEDKRILVVEGNITTQFGPHTVRVSESTKYGSIFDGFSKKIENAQVSVRDNMGNVVNLAEVDKGVYQTPSDFRAVAGRSYSLLIFTRQGRSYSSLPDKVQKVPALDSISVVFKKIPTATEKFRSGLEVRAHFRDPEETTNFYMWKNTGTYLRSSNPELYRDPETGVLMPKECCSRCWISETGDEFIRLYKDNNTNGGNIVVPVAFIEDDGGRFTDKYLIRIEQASISKEAFQFFDLLQEQLDISGNIFDPPPATIRGNMIDLDFPGQPVIGFFRASDVAIDSLFLLRDFLDEFQKSIQINDDCRLLQGATAETPSFWY